MTSTWFNKDGLRVKYGTDEVIPTVSGELNVLGSSHIVETVLDMTTLTSTDAILPGYVEVPKGALIEKVETFVLEASTGSSSTFTFGLYKTDNTGVLDADAFIAAQVLTTLDAVGETTLHQLASTYAGSSIGTVLAANGIISAKYGTAAFTDGTVRIRVYYTMTL